MKIKGLFAAGIAVVIIFAGIFITKLTGDWATEGRKIPRRISVGDYAGMYDPGDIRGSYSFADIANSFAVTPDEIARAFALPTDGIDPADYKAKDLEEYYGEIPDGTGELGTDSLRWFVALATGYPYTPEPETLIPSPALALLKTKGVIDETVIAELRERSVSPGIFPESSHTPESTSSLESSEDHETGEESDRMIKGKTTFADLYDWGLTEEEIESATGYEVGKRAEILRDYFSEQGASFGEMKSILQVIIDSRK